MSSDKKPLPNILIFGLPIALGALILPAVLLLLRPSPVQAPSPQPVTTVDHSTHTAAAAAPEVHLTVKEWGFEPTQLRLPVDQPVTLVLDNKGQLDHDVSIPSLGVQLKANAGLRP